MIGVGAVGIVGGQSRRRAAPSGAPDFTLSNATVTTDPTLAVLVGNFVISNAPAGSYIVIEETAGLSGDEAGLAVVNG